MFLLVGMDSLEAHMQVSGTIEFGKVCHHELWLSHGRRNGFLHRTYIQDSELGLYCTLKCFTVRNSKCDSPNMDWMDNWMRLAILLIRGNNCACGGWVTLQIFTL